VAGEVGVKPTPAALPPILLLHGFTGSSEAWPTNAVDALAVERTVLAVDLPGHGRSGWPDGASRYGVHDLVDDLVALLDERGEERADWAGYSMGGRMALGAAILRPERVRRLVLESASPGLRTESERAERARADGALADELEARGIEWFVDHWMGLPVFATEASLPEGVRMAERERRLGNDPRALAAALRGLGIGTQPSLWERLGEVRCPVVLLTGAEDRKYESIAHEMAALLPTVVHRSIEGAGHRVHLEDPGAWAREVRAFLGRS
jgi:2-succinyl-6-hydroxy-2,4-cyclohexadiene-1-carboxylate synthase